MRSNSSTPRRIRLTGGSRGVSRNQVRLIRMLVA